VILPHGIVWAGISTRMAGRKCTRGSEMAGDCDNYLWRELVLAYTWHRFGSTRSNTGIDLAGTRVPQVSAIHYRIHLGVLPLIFHTSALVAARTMSTAAVVASSRRKRRRRGVHDDDDDDVDATAGSSDMISATASDGGGASTPLDAAARMPSSQPPPPSPSAPHDGNNDASMPVQPDHIYQALHRLNDEYSRLSSKEEQIEKYLATLQQEEIALRTALELTSTSLKDQRISEKKRKEEEALSRLEEALMMGDDDDDSSEDEDVD
jgi:hypothetical protein